MVDGVFNKILFQPYERAAAFASNERERKRAVELLLINVELITDNDGQLKRYTASWVKFLQ